MLRGTWKKWCVLALGGCAVAFGTSTPARAEDPAAGQLLERLDRLEKQNQDLKKELDGIKQAPPGALDVADTDGKAAGLDKKGVQKIVEDYMKSQDKKKKDDEAAKKATADAEGYKVGSDLSIKPRWDGYGLRFETPNKDFSVHIGGRINFDTVGWSVDPNLQRSTQLGPFEDGSFFRRLRLQMDGTFWEVCEFNMEFQFEQVSNNNTGGGTTNFNPNGLINLDEMWVGIQKVPLIGTVRVGHVKTQQGLESLSSSKAIQFLERSSVFDCFWGEFMDGIWVTNTLFNERATVHAQFGRGVGAAADLNDNTGALFGDGSYDYVGRVTALPYYENEGRCLVHVGTSLGYYQNNQNGGRGNVVPFNGQDNAFRYRARFDQRDSIGGAFNGNPNRVIDTGAFIADSSVNWATELLVIAGPASLQAEYNYTTVQSPFAGGAARSDPAFHGYYVTLSYFLTGENRQYDKRLGRLGSRVIAQPYTPFFLVSRDCGGTCWGWGAVEALVGFDHLDLDSQAFQAGQLDQVRAGINWYLNPNFKVQFQYLHGSRYHLGPTPAGATIGNATGNLSGDADAFGIRTVLEF